MDGNELFALMKRLKGVCKPTATVEILPTRQPDEIYLVVVQFPSTDLATVVCPASEKSPEDKKLEAFFKENPALQTAYFWEKQQIHSLHYEKILPLINDADHFRIIYGCGSGFVFYTRTFGWTKNYVYEFNNYNGDSKENFDYIGLKTEENEYYKYVGICKSIDLFIEYLLNTYKAL